MQHADRCPEGSFDRDEAFAEVGRCEEPVDDGLGKNLRIRKCDFTRSTGHYFEITRNGAMVSSGRPILGVQLRDVVSNLCVAVANPTAGTANEKVVWQSCGAGGQPTDHRQRAASDPQPPAAARSAPCPVRAGPDGSPRSSPPQRAALANVARPPAPERSFAASAA